MDDQLLIQNKDLTAVPNPYYTFIPEFKKIIDEFDPERAAQIFAYIWHMVSRKSSFFGIPEDRKEDAILRSIGLTKTIAKQKRVQAALECYEKVHKSHFVILLESAIHVLHKIREYFDEVDFADLDTKGNIRHKPRDIIATIKDLGPAILSVEELRKKVEEEELSNERIRKGVELSKYNE